MDLLVFAIVILMLGSALALALCGLNEMLFNPDCNNEKVNLLTGLCLTEFGAAILICCGHNNIPFGKGEAYIVPLGFCAVGVLFLANALFTLYNRCRQAQQQ